MSAQPTKQQHHPQANSSDYWPSSRPHFALSRLRKAHLKDYLLRFFFGGAVSVLATLIGHLVTTRFGGIFTAFPAILLASLTLIGKQEGQEPSAEDAEGGAVGAAALIVTAAFIAATIVLMAGAASLLAALGLWLLLAVGLYLLCLKIGWLRTSQAEEQQ